MTADTLATTVALHDTLGLAVAQTTMHGTRVTFTVSWEAAWVLALLLAIGVGVVVVALRDVLHGVRGWLRRVVTAPFAGQPGSAGGFSTTSTGTVLGTGRGGAGLRGRTTW